MNPRTIKAELLLHYAEREPHAFAQFDGHLNCHPDDCVMPGDECGDALTGGRVHELRRPGSDVRVSILAGIPQADAVRLVRKLAHWIEFGGLYDEMTRVQEVPDDTF